MFPRDYHSRTDLDCTQAADGTAAAAVARAVVQLLLPTVLLLVVPIDAAVPPSNLRSIEQQPITQVLHNPSPVQNSSPTKIYLDSHVLVRQKTFSTHCVTASGDCKPGERCGDFLLLTQTERKRQSISRKFAAANFSSLPARHIWFPKKVVSQPINLLSVSLFKVVQCNHFSSTNNDTACGYVRFWFYLGVAMIAVGYHMIASPAAAWSRLLPQDVVIAANQIVQFSLFMRTERCV